MDANVIILTQREGRGLSYDLNCVVPSVLIIVFAVRVDIIILEPMFMCMISASFYSFIYYSHRHAKEVCSTTRS